MLDAGRSLGRSASMLMVSAGVLVAGPIEAGQDPGASWTQLRGDAANSGFWGGTLNTSGIGLDWSATAALGRGLDFVTGSQPVVSSDGSTVFALAAEDPIGESGFPEKHVGTGHIVALDAYTGSQLWSTEVLHHGDFTSTSSAAYHDGALYWAGGFENPDTRFDGSFQETTRAYRLDAATGSIAWEQDIDGSGQGIVNTSPTIADGQMFISTYGGFFTDRPTHHAFDIEEDSETWKQSDGGRIPGAMTHDAERGLVYQLVYGDHGPEGEDDYLRAYDAQTGETAWTSHWTLSEAASAQAIALVNDELYFQDQAFGVGTNLYRVSLTEADAWNIKAGTISRAASAVSPDGLIFSAGQDIGGWQSDGPGQIRAHDSNGQLLWSFDNIGGGFSNSPIWADGLVMIGEDNGDAFYLLDEMDGTLVRTLTGSGPAAFGTDRFFTIGQDGTMYAYTIPEPGSLALLSGGLLLMMRRRR